MKKSSQFKYLRWFEAISSKDTALVGGKNASLGEMIRALKSKGISVPDGFATTAEAYWLFIEKNQINDKLRELLDDWKRRKCSLQTAGKAIRRLFRRGHFSEEMRDEIHSAYRELSRRFKRSDVDVAVRSSATAEDLPEASFAGQQETFLNISGEDEVLQACRDCFASLFTDRAISYREEKGFDHLKIALSAGVQKMVRSDLAGAGVMFSIDTETGFPRVVSINAAWGLGEMVVQGTVMPDEYTVFKPLLKNKRPIIGKRAGGKEKKMIYATGGSKATRTVDTTKEERHEFVLNDDEILQLAKWACVIEEHYGKPMDMEWAKDGETGKLFIVQARPETVHSQKKPGSQRVFRLKEKGEPVLTGLSIGQAIAAGPVCKIRSAAEIGKFKEGSILVTGMTDPDWVPIMKQAKGIITDSGGRTCHAAIVSRELKIPAIVGTEEATRTLKDGDDITLSCAEGDQGLVYRGLLKFEEKEVDYATLPETKTRVMINLASPVGAFSWWQLPCHGIGLARMEFIINNVIKIHPMALVRFDQLKDAHARREIAALTAGFEDKREYFIQHLARGIGTIAASQYPEPVIVRMSDFKSNEYANLIGGSEFELPEDNPMIGFRGASRYYHERYRDGFALECQAIERVRNEMGFTNVVIMIPFCRTVEEADNVLKVLAKNRLKRGRNGLEVYVMCEIPSNVVLADEFSKRFDGFSIGSNDLTQLVLGIDRDSAMLAGLFDERNEAVKRMIRDLIKTAHKAKRKVGICGEAPSNYPEFAEFLVECGIDSISLSPDSVAEVKRHIARAEKEKSRG